MEPLEDVIDDADKVAEGHLVNDAAGDTDGPAADADDDSDRPEILDEEDEGDGSKLALAL